MRKNTASLIKVILACILVGVVSVLSMINLKEDLNLDSEFGSGYQIVYTVDSEEEDVINEIATILQKRFTGFGATSAEATIDGSTITFEVIGIDDIESIRTYMTQTGTLTFRNASDETIMDVSVLAEDQPISIFEEDEVVYINIAVEDTTTFYYQTENISNATNNYLILWVDFDDLETTYSDEASSDSPTYFGAATVSDGISGDCYIASSQSLEVSQSLAVIINSGALTAEVSETSIDTVTIDATKIDSAYTILIVVTLLVCIGLTVLYRLPGLVTGLLSLAYAACYFRINAFATALFNSTSLATFAISLTISLTVLIALYRSFKQYLLKGRNISASLNNAYSEYNSVLFETGLIQIIVGGVAYIANSTEFKEIGFGLLIGGGLDIIFFVLANRYILANLIDSNYVTNKALFGVKEENLPDVEKGEHYVDDSKVYQFAKAFNGNLPYIVAIVVAVLAVIMAIVIKPENILLALVVALVTIVTGTIYSRIRYKKYVTVVCGASVMGALASALVSAIFGSEAVVTGSAVALATTFLVLSLLINAYGEFAREKITTIKVDNMINKVLTSYVNIIIFSAVVALAYGFTSTNFTAFIILVVVAIVTGYFTVALFKNYITTKTSKKGKNKKNKTKKKEFKENTIYGINEVKR